ncbi:hypothetical protein ACHAPJ_006543 [Fusarium lateritium]
MVAIKSALVFLTLGAEAAAVSSSNIVCTSKLGTKSVAPNKIPRATTTVANKITITKKVTRKVNVVVVPRPKTVTEKNTIVVTSTSTADPDVETATEWVTDEQTETVDVLSTQYEYETESITTTKSITQTVQAPAGFTKIRESPDYVAKRIKARVAAGKVSPNAIPAIKAGKAATVQEYVQRVDCFKKVPTTSTKYTTVTVQGVRKTLQPKTKTKTVDTTSTLVETEYPPEVTETVTETASPTVTEYNTILTVSTLTESVTVEAQVPGPTNYLACSDENFLSFANGGNPVNDFYSINQQYTAAGVSGIKNAYECCVACLNNPRCFTSLSSLASPSTCYHYTAWSDVCPGGQISWSTYSSSPGDQPLWTWSNGPCGSIANAGNH